MRRRGLLSLLGGAVVAGPSMAKTAISTGLEGLSIGGAGIGIPDAPYGAVATALGPSDEYDPVKWARDELAQFLGKSAEDELRERLETYVTAIDPDLAIMQSISLTSKLRIQRDRNYERNQRQHVGYLRRNISETIKRMAS